MINNSEQSQKNSSPAIEPSRKFSVAPMMDWTDRHYRYMARLLSKHTLLYTEMVTTGAIIHG
ncbi:tRNA-dihydrouridine synthase, partial [Oleiphilus sp. HI0123]